MRVFTQLLAVLAAVISFAGPLWAQAGDVSRLTLIPGWMRSDGLYMAAVKIDLAPGWKTYWRAPGDNGIAPIFDWSRSSNLAQVGYYWPAPNVFDHDGTRTIGFERELILPVLLRPKRAGEAITARVSADYGVCDDICLPAQATATLTVDPSKVYNKDTIETALALRTVEAHTRGLVSSTCTITPDGEGYVLTAELAFDRAPDAHRIAIVETGSEMIWASEADQAYSTQVVRLEADLYYFGEGAMTLDRSNLRFTLINDGHGIDISGCSAG